MTSGSNFAMRSCFINTIYSKHIAIMGEILREIKKTYSDL